MTPSLIPLLAIPPFHHPPFPIPNPSDCTPHHPNPNDPRPPPPGVCALNNCIYPLGGYDGADQLNSTERYDVESDTWSFVAPMRYRRSALGVTVYQGKIYVLGGWGPGVPRGSRSCWLGAHCEIYALGWWGPRVCGPMGVPMLLGWGPDARSMSWVRGVPNTITGVYFGTGGSLWGSPIIVMGGVPSQ